MNTASKHSKPTRANEQGGIIDKDMPIDASNVMLVHKGKQGPCRLQDQGRRRQGAHRPSERRGDLMTDTDRPPTPQRRRHRRRYPSPEGEVQRRGRRQARRTNSASRTSCRCPKLEKIVVNMGMGRAAAQPSLDGRRTRRPHRDHRSEADRHEGQASPSPTSSCVRARPSVPRSRCAATACGSSSTVSCPWPSPVSATSAACRPTRGTARATTPSVSTNSRCSPRSTPTRSTTPAAWTSRSSRRQRATTGGYALLDAFGFPFKKGEDAANAPRKKRRKRPQYGKKSK